MIRTQALKHFPGAREGERAGGKKGVRGGVTARGSMEKSRYVRIIEGEEVRRDDPIIYFLPTEVRSTFRVPEGVMTIEVPRTKRFLEEERMEEKKSRFCHRSEKSK